MIKIHIFARAHAVISKRCQNKLFLLTFNLRCALNFRISLIIKKGFYKQKRVLLELFHSSWNFTKVRNIYLRDIHYHPVHSGLQTIPVYTSNRIGDPFWSRQRHFYTDLNYKGVLHTYWQPRNQLSPRWRPMPRLVVSGNETKDS